MFNDQKQNEPACLTKQDIKDISERAMRLRLGPSGYTGALIKCFIEHVSKVYGVDIGFETEEMSRARDSAKSKETNLKRRKLVGRKSGDGFDRF